jgi:beta-glucanase (GH16 family)
VSRAGSARPKRSWVLANLVGGGVIIIGLSIALLGIPGSGDPAADSALKPHPAKTVRRAACTQFEQMVNECAATTTTTTTTTTKPTAGWPSSDPVGQGGGTTTHTSTPRTTPTTAPAPPPAAAAGSTAAGAPAVAQDASACSGAAPPVAAPSGSWHCTFDDEFNGSSLDTSNWAPMLTDGSGYETGPYGNQPCYVNDPSTISESGGYLDLSIVKEASYTSCPGIWPSASTTDLLGGMVDTYHLFSQQYGFFETRALMPPSSVPGLQDTLWLYPEDETKYGPWPDSGEIDYGQWYSEFPNNDYPGNVFPGASSDPQAETNTCTISGQSPAGQFHTYALMWTPTTLTEYYDGVACLTDTYGSHVTSPDTAPEPFNQPFFVALTAALGSFNGDDYNPYSTPLPATMQVDWMRVWQYG